MKVKLNKVAVEGVEIEGLEIEGNVTEYMKAAGAVQSLSVENLGKLFNVLAHGSKYMRAEAKEWKKTIDELEA